MGKIIERVRARQLFEARARHWRDQAEADIALRLQYKRKREALDKKYAEACEIHGRLNVIQFADGTFAIHAAPQDVKKPWWRVW